LAQLNHTFPLTLSISDKWDPHVGLPFSTNHTFSLELASRRCTDRGRAREERTAGPPSCHARRARAWARGPPQGESAGGKVPYAPAGDATGAVVATGGRPRCQSRLSNQSWSAGVSLPSRRFDRASTTPGIEPSPRHSRRPGVFPPFKSVAPQRGEKGGGGRAGEVEAEQGRPCVASSLACR
jgi:hypothetical protein